MFIYCNLTDSPISENYSSDILVNFTAMRLDFRQFDESLEFCYFLN